MAKSFIFKYKLYNWLYQIMTQSIEKDINYFITSIISAATLFTTWRTIRTQYHIYQTKKSLKNIQNKDLLQVDDAVAKIKGRGKEINEVVILQGKIGTDPGKQIQYGGGWTTKKEKLALKLTWTEAMYSNDSFDLKRNNYTINLKEALKNCNIEGGNKLHLSGLGNNKILLRNFDQKDYSKAIQILKWQEKKQSLGLADKIYVILLGLLRVLLMVGSQGKDGEYLRGIEVGKRHVESGIKIGATVTILGTLSVSLDGDNLIEVQSIFKDRLSEINNLKEELEGLIKQRNIWLLGSVGGAIYLGRRAYKYIKKHDIKIPYINP